MPTPTTTYSLSKPTVGGDDNAWGNEINNNLDKLDDLLDGTLPITPDLGAGWEVGGVAVTASAAELNVLDGVTASTAEINILDGVTATAADLNLTADATIAALAAYNTNGILTQTASDTFTGRTITGTANQITVTNGNGVSGNPTVAAVVASQAEAEAGTDNTKLMTPLRVKQELNASGAAPIYACRAWVNFNGTGTVAIRAAGNVSSITDNGTGRFTVNFTTALPDANYAAFVTIASSNLQFGCMISSSSSLGAADTKTTTALQVRVVSDGGTLGDPNDINVAIFR
jgi:hypothetical protein